MGRRSNWEEDILRDKIISHLKRAPDMPTNQVSKLFGVSNYFVRCIRKKLENKQEDTGGECERRTIE